MSAPFPHRKQPRHQRGVGIVETMVGILIGLVVVVVVYNLIAATEGYRRMTASVGDAQVTGLLSQFMASRDVGNGGNGLGLDTPTLRGLISCRTVAALGSNVNSDLRPIPVLITAGASAAASDSFIVMHSGSSRVLWPVPLLDDYTGSGDTFSVQSPNGFSKPDGTSIPTADNPFLVVIADDENGCQFAKVTSATAPIVTGLGRVDLTFETAPTLPSSGKLVGGGESPATVINLGPLSATMRTRYEVYNPTAPNIGNCAANNAQGCQLYTTDLLAAGATRNPIAQNVVLLKAQYGIDTNNDQTVDCWTSADNLNACGDGRDYSADAVRDPAIFPNLADLNRILAVRVAIVVRSDEPAVPLLDPSVVHTSRATDEGKDGVRRDMYLFNCPTDTDAACQGRILVPDGRPATIQAANCNPGIICDGWRYRAYETVIPLRNSIYNATL